MFLSPVLFFQKLRVDVGAAGQLSLTDNINKRLHSFPYSPGLYESIESNPGAVGTLKNGGMSDIALQLGLKVPNLAPDIDSEELPAVPAVMKPARAVPTAPQEPDAPPEPKKKKYAKEAWPGKKPTAHSFLV